jgi:hypothetical protein
MEDYNMFIVYATAFAAIVVIKGAQWNKIFTAGIREGAAYI